ncbi:MAG: hypothetical protein LUD71_00405, partial [Clostridiales bacterium]|nr:hypothetical protein [Clostridiales bacterium]
MKGKNGLLKRWIAVALSAAMVFNLCPNGLTLLTASAEENEDPTITTGYLMTAAYADSLSSGEIAVLESGLLNESTYTYVVPTAETTDSDGNNLVTVEEETVDDGVSVTITARTYTDDYDNHWTPGATKVTYSDSSADTVTLSDADSDGTYTGSFTRNADDNSYSVSVDYSIGTVADADEQKRLYNTIEWLYTGIQDWGSVYTSLYDDLKVMITYIDTLYNARSAIDLFCDGASSSIEDYFYAQYLTSQTFNLVTIFDSYKISPSEVVLNANDKTELETCYSHLKNVNTGLTGFLSMVGMQLGNGDSTTLGGVTITATQYNAMVTWNSALTSALTSVTGICDSSQNSAKWDWLSTYTENGKCTLVSDSVDYEKLDTLLGDLEEDYSSSTDIVFTDLPIAASASIEVSQSMHNVEVVINAEAIDTDSDEWKNNTSTTTKTFTGNITVSDGSDGDNVYAAAGEIIADALDEWEAFDVNGTYYVESDSSYSYDNNSDEIVKIEITYTPNQYTVSTTWDNKSQTVPYGYVYTFESAETGYIYQ